MIRDLSELETPPEYIVCITKAIDLESILPLFKNVVTDNTTIVIIQNGVGNEDPFRSAYPQCTIISCVAWVGARQDEPGVIKHFAIENTMMGVFPNPDIDGALEKERLDRFAGLLKDGQTPVAVEEDVQVKRWEKCIWNAAWNSSSAIAQITSQEWIHSSDEAITTLKDLMREMVQVAKACGLDMDNEIPDKFMERMSNLQAVYGSMYADLMNGRPLEVEVLLGTPMRKARELGVGAPVLNTFYSITKAIDVRLRKAKQSQ